MENLYTLNNGSFSPGPLCVSVVKITMKNHNLPTVISRFILFFGFTFVLFLASATNLPAQLQPTPTPISTNPTSTGLNQGRTGISQTSRTATRTPTKHSTKKGSATATPGSGGRAAPQGKSAIPKPKKGPAGKAAATAAPLPPKYQLSSKIQSNTLYFFPSKISAVANQRFSAPLLFYNARGDAMDHFDLWMHYNPEVLEPVWINMDEIKDDLDGPMERDLWRNRGYLRLRGKFKAPLPQLVQPLFTINWQARGTPTQTEIEFSPPSGCQGGIFAGEKNCLALSDVGNRGLVSLEVRVAPSEENLKDDRPTVIARGEDPFLPGVILERGVHLALTSAKTDVESGQIATLDVALINPDWIPFDSLRFRLRFDPQIVEILDADENNYITKGINIYDGGFHDAMPFDLHLANEVNSNAGTIDYRVGDLQGVHSYPSGAVARVVFRVRQDAAEALFWFDAGSDTEGPLCDIRARGRSILGNPGEKPAESLHNLRIAVSNR